MWMVVSTYPASEWLLADNRRDSVCDVVGLGMSLAPGDRVE
jgi:hypothetical protein